MADDALSQILEALRLRGSVYFHTYFNPPWAVAVPAYANVARFHVVMRGSCWLRVEGAQEPIKLAAGDLAVIPHGAAHTLSDAIDRKAITLDEVVMQTGFDGTGALAYGGPDMGESCKLFCGHFEFSEAATHPVLAALPVCLHIPNTQTLNTHWLDTAIRFVGAEIAADRAGSNAIVLRLSEIIFIQVIRAFVDAQGDAAGALAAVLHPQLGPCLSRVHAELAQPWTVEAMAKEAGMSRTAFAERFAALVGTTPVDYVTRWRMQRTRLDLEGTDLALIEIAERVGYGSEASLIRAFKRHFGSTPAEVRRQSRQ